MRFILLSVCLVGGLSANPDIYIGLSPNEAMPKSRDLEIELSRRLGEKVVLYIAKDYDDLYNAFQSGKLNFAILPPRLAIKLESSSQIKYLLKKVYGQSEYYYAAIVTLGAARYSGLKSLKGKKLGFVDPESASGYLYPRQMLIQAGLSPGSFVETFWGTHEKALDALARKEVDAVGVWADDPASKKGAWTKFSQNLPAGLKFKTLAYSEPIPNDPLIVREDFQQKHPAKVLRLMEVLLALSEDGSLIKEVTGADRLTTATKTHFETVRQLENKASGELKTAPKAPLMGR